MGTPRKSGRQRKVLDYKKLAKGLGSFDDDSDVIEDDDITFVPLTNAGKTRTPRIVSDSSLHSQQGVQTSKPVSKTYELR